MKLLFIYMLFVSNMVYAQTKLVKDIDFDGIKDKISINTKNLCLMSSLSTQKFRKMNSGEIESLDAQGELKCTANGFELIINWMRAGYACQFRYNKLEKRIQLIGMSRYEFGPASNDGSGESSVNLLTGNYIGNWNYYDLKKEQLIKIPTIKTKMLFPKTFFENFSEKIYSIYSERCASLFNERKSKLQK
jgi:hypothetical protein